MAINDKPVFTAGQKLTPEQIAKLKAGEYTGKFAPGVDFRVNQVQRGTSVGADAEFMDDPTGAGTTLYYQARNASNFGGNDVTDVWDKDGNYLGTSSGMGELRGLATIVASALGGAYVNGGFGAESAVGGAGGGMSGLDLAAIDAGAGATNVGSQIASTAGMTAAEQASMMAANGMTDVEIANVLGGQIGSDLTGTGMNAIANGGTIADGANSFRPSQNYGDGLTGSQTTVYDKVIDVTGSGTMANALATNPAVADGLVKTAEVVSSLSDANSVKNASDAANSGNKGGSNSMNWLDVINTAVGIYGVAKAGENSSDATDAMQNVANGQMALNQEALNWYK